MIGDHFPQLFAFLRGVMAIGIRMRREPAELDALIAEMTELVDERVKIVGGLFLVEEEGPAADREFFHDESTKPRGERSEPLGSSAARSQGFAALTPGLACQFHPCASRTAII